MNTVAVYIGAKIRLLTSGRVWACMHGAGGFHQENIDFQNVSLPWSLPVCSTQFGIHLRFLYW